MANAPVEIIGDESTQLCVSFPSAVGNKICILGSWNFLSQQVLVYSTEGWAIELAVLSFN